MPDDIFEHPRLVAIYDALDPDRSDLDVYAAIAEELGASRVLDIGCGTGTFALLLARRGLEVIAVDPAAGSIAVAKGKPGAERVQWIHGDATGLPPMEVDLATMTANVAQAIADPQDWRETLRGAYDALRPGGHLVFETRDPAYRAWQEWNRAASYSQTEIPGVGAVESWVEVTDVSGPLVTFCSTVVFASDGEALTSESTLRFRERDEVEASLTAQGFVVDEVRGAPDRPGREFVFLARRPRRAATAGYVPLVSAETADRIHRWHENAYRAGKAEGRSEQTFTYLHTTLIVPPQVMPITGMSHLLGEAVLAEVRDGDRVLDMGTGSGVNAILAATKSTDVVAVDINPRAVEAAQANVGRNGVTARVDVRHSDVFSNVDGAFDLIVFDPPFRWFAPRDQLEVAMTDENYATMTTFFREARDHLTPDGRMLIFFGTSGDLDYLQQLAAEERFATEVLAHESLRKDEWQVDYFTFRLTKSDPGRTVVDPSD